VGYEKKKPLKPTLFMSIVRERLATLDKEQYWGWRYLLTNDVAKHSVLQYYWVLGFDSDILLRSPKTVRDSLNTHPPQWPYNLEKRGSSSARLSIQSRYRFSR
jgi:hypothetical protein